MKHDAFAIIPDDITALAVACSGGADSLCLTLELHEWCKQRNIQCIALHVNHNIRSEAAREAEQLREWLKQYDIDCNLFKVEKNLREEGNLQQAARDARYGLMTDWCRENKVRHLCLAHHADDQAETFLMRMARGSGVDGLSAMKPVTARSGITLLRPYLYTTKKELMERLKQKSQCWIEDPSNKNTSFTRVVMRDVLPVLEEASITSRHIVNICSHLARASDCLQNVAKDWAIMQQVWKGGVYATIPKDSFSDTHKEIALRVVADCLRYFNSEELRFKHLEPLVDAMQCSDFKKTTLHHCIIQPYHDDILIYREEERLQNAVPMQKKTLWDGYVCITKTMQEEFRCGALGAEGFAQLKAQKHPLPTLPAALLHTLPAIWHLEQLYAVPHIDYYTQPCDDTLLSLRAHYDEPQGT